MKFLNILILLSLISACSFSRYKPGDQDHFKSFSELKAKLTEGQDYRIVNQKNNSSILITAFHGGFIESGSSELALAIAQDRFDYYSFEALYPGNMHEESFTSSSLHITSTRFDEPILQSILPTKQFCVGLHGFGGKEADFCVGGGNELEREKLTKALKKDFPNLVSCNLCCPPFNGTSQKNPINKCIQKGVQVEISPRVRKEILNSDKFKSSVAETFRNYLNSFGI